MNQEMLSALIIATGLPVTHKVDPSSKFDQFAVSGRRNFVRMTKLMTDTMMKEGIGGISFEWLVAQLKGLPR